MITSDVSGGTRVPILHDCMLTNLLVVASGTLGSGKTATITVLTNGVATSLSTTITGASPLKNTNTTASAFVGQGYEIGVSITTASGSTAAKFAWSFETQ